MESFSYLLSLNFILLVSVKSPVLLQPLSLVGRIPSGSRYVFIFLLCDLAEGNNQICVFDQLNLSIFQANVT